MKRIKMLLQLMFGYSLMACYGRVNQFKTFWTLRDAEDWMRLYPHGSSVLICRWHKPVMFRRTLWQ